MLFPKYEDEQTFKRNAWEIYVACRKTYSFFFFFAVIINEYANGKRLIE